MKKIMNSADSYVSDMLEGIAKADPELEYDEMNNVIYRKTCTKKVGIVSGGGSGHEPAHAGFVGTGMLDAAVAGNIFASPSAEQILAGIEKANQGEGVLLIIKNYSGDIMNFQMAAELAEFDDINVDYVIVKDDVAVPESTYSTGRRGIAGTVFVHKIAGAAAERGYPLAEVKRIAQKTADQVRSMGMAMSACILPGVGTPGFVLGDDEIEIGMGIHGEPGIHKATMKSASEIAHILIEKIFSDFSFAHSRVAIMVNGLGSTPLSELFILNREVHQVLTDAGISIVDSHVGNFMTSLEMTGCSISMLKLDAELEELLFDKANTLAMKVGV